MGDLFNEVNNKLTKFNQGKKTKEEKKQEVKERRKQRILQHACKKISAYLRLYAKKGRRELSLYKLSYKEDIVGWLRSEGFNVEEFSDATDGEYIEITW